jgi:hypothetical protein
MTIEKEARHLLAQLCGGLRATRRGFTQGAGELEADNQLPRPAGHRRLSRQSCVSSRLRALE